MSDTDINEAPPQGQPQVMDNGIAQWRPLFSSLYVDRVGGNVVVTVSVEGQRERFVLSPEQAAHLARLLTA